ncbi:MAG: NgoMIV family type II restriction endonuclease [Promicromonosporaceae bacterium]|nr:NgoMIV family type II restriction endonuclease [Promicromonosporaceae bacterium]
MNKQSQNSPALLAQERHEFHAELLNNGTLTVDVNGIASNADKGNRQSVQWAGAIAAELQLETRQEKRAGQTTGSGFEAACVHFLKETFPHLNHLRPGTWEITQVGGRRASSVAEFEQYSHLADLALLVKEVPTLRTALGNAYQIAPDIIIARHPVADNVINSHGAIVDNEIAIYSSLRENVQSLPILHSVISCKWTLRSDRAQNARTEALNLIRNRKGQLPHIVVVTGEPTPSRIASLALGTGDIDCTYHFALYELMEAVHESNNDDAQQLLQDMIDGKRLKDISDLPLDLAV